MFDRKKLSRLLVAEGLKKARPVRVTKFRGLPVYTMESGDYPSERDTMELAESLVTLDYCDEMVDADWSGQSPDPNRAIRDGERKAEEVAERLDKGKSIGKWGDDDDVLDSQDPTYDPTPTDYYHAYKVVALYHWPDDDEWSALWAVYQQSHNC